MAGDLPRMELYCTYRLPGMEPVARLTNQASIAGFNFSPLQDEVAIASRGQVEFWSTTSWQRTRGYQLHRHR
jgi:hypothetical protein